MIYIYTLPENTGLHIHWSDKNAVLLQQETGAEYFEPIDCYPCRFTYIETEEIKEEDEYQKIRNGYARGELDKKAVKEAFLDDVITAYQYDYIVSLKEEPNISEK